MFGTFLHRSSVVSVITECWQNSRIIQRRREKPTWRTRQRKNSKTERAPPEGSDVRLASLRGRMYARRPSGVPSLGSPLLSFAWQAWDNVHCHGVGCTLTHSLPPSRTSPHLSSFRLIACEFIIACFCMLGLLRS